MDDSELIRLAGLAAGFEYSAEANPLIDDALALRLAVKLRMTVQCSFAPVWVEVAIPELEVVENHNNTDPLAATRRAITRAAAMIGGYRE